MSPMQDDHHTLAGKQLVPNRVQPRTGKETRQQRMERERWPQHWTDQPGHETDVTQVKRDE